MTGNIATTCPYSAASGSDPDAIGSLTSYVDVDEVFRSAKVAPFLHDGTEEFRGGTVRQIDGPRHRLRRRTMGRLLRGQADARFREEVLMPTIERNLQRVLEVPTQGPPATDMVLFARVTFFQLVATLIGLDGVNTADDAEELRQFAEPIQVAMRSWYMRGDRSAVMARGVEVRDQFRARYFDPALGRRLALVKATTTPEGEAELPNDFLTLVARDLDADWSADHGLALREAVTDFINAGTFSSSFTLVHALDEALTWADHHPAERARLLDETFLADVVAESLRLHPIVPLFYRTATESVTLKSGRTVEAGQHIGMEIGPANRDREVFGPDADLFVPGRAVPPGVYPYGVAFGSGRHICYGLPVIMGSDGVNGSHVQILKALFSAGVCRDPSKKPRKNDQFGQMDGLFDHYPIRFMSTAAVGS
jgi:cytochrome P450